MGDKNVTLANQCMDFCRHLEAKGKAFKFSLSIGSDFTFTLDTREEATTFKKEVRKKLSPSSIRRNARRKQEFLKKKSVSSENSSATDEKESDTPDKTENTPEKAVNTSVELHQPASQKDASQQPDSQPWRRPSTCRRCGLSTKGHPGPYGEGRCRVSLSGLPSLIRVEKCSDCFDHPRPPCNTHRKPLADQFT